MKRAISISLGSSKRDKKVVVNFNGEEIQVERVGTDGNIAKARQMYLELDGKVYRVAMHFREVDTLHKALEAGLTIDSLDAPNPESAQTEISFHLDYFNFPLIDNTRLPNNHRFAVVLDKFDDTQIKVKGILFSGMYASQRDKPFLNEAIQQLNKQQSKDKE